jgi:hypothetical protein
MDKESIYSGVLFNHKKEWNYIVSWNKPAAERWISHCLSYVVCRSKKNDMNIKGGLFGSQWKGGGWICQVWKWKMKPIKIV